MQIDLFSDTVCPWCRIGKRHLELALAEWAADSAEPVTLRYRSFFLDPTIPPEGRDFRSHMTAKGAGAWRWSSSSPRRANAGRTPV